MTIFSEKTTQKLFGFTIAYMVSFQGLLNCINATTESMKLHTSMDTILLYGIFMLATMMCVLQILFSDRKKLDVFAMTMAFVLAFIFTLIIFPENTKYILPEKIDIFNIPLVTFFIFSFLGFVIIRYMTDFKIFWSYMRILSYIVIILSALIYFFLDESFAIEYMTLSYNMLAQVFCLILDTPKRFKLLRLSAIVIGVYIIFVGGSRGAMLSLCVGIALMIMFGIGLSKFKKTLGVGCMLVSGVSLFVFYEQILTWIAKFVKKFNISSRTIELLLHGEGVNTSGRDVLQSELFKNLNLFGHGLFGDRELLDGLYAHNLFLELWVDLGLIIGGFISIAFVVLVITALKRADNQTRKYLILFLPGGLIATQFSGSYLSYSVALFVFLGICVNAVQKKS